MVNKLLASVLFVVVFASMVSACSLNVVMVNQDPYPAMPDDYVKVVFQVSGLESSDCGSVEFWINEKYPFSLDPGAENKVVMKSGTYLLDYQKYFLVPYNLRVDKDALDGDNNLTVHYSFLSGGQQTGFQKDFNINVEDSRTDFEVFVSDYSSGTKELTLNLLNIGEEDVEGLTIEVPKQDGLKIIGANQIIIGDLSSNEDDSATFKADLNEMDLTLNIFYTDQIGVRRFLQKSVHFDPTLFENLEQQQKSFSPTVAFIIGLLIPLVIGYIRHRIRKRREKLKKKGMVKF